MKTLVVAATICMGGCGLTQPLAPSVPQQLAELQTNIDRARQASIRGLVERESRGAIACLQFRGVGIHSGYDSALNRFEGNAAEAPVTGSVFVFIYEKKDEIVVISDLALPCVLAPEQMGKGSQIDMKAQVKGVYILHLTPSSQTRAEFEGTLKIIAAAAATKGNTSFDGSDIDFVNGWDSNGSFNRTLINPSAAAEQPKESRDTLVRLSHLYDVLWQEFSGWKW